MRRYAGRMDAPHYLPAMDWTECPLVEFNPRKVSGAALLKGTRMPADVVLENWEDGSTVAEIADDFDIPEESVRGLLEYSAKQDAAREA